MTTPPDMTEYQKAAVTVIKDVAVQLILIAVGVFAVAGSFLTTKTGGVASRGWLISAFVLFMVSVLAGLVALGSAVAQLSASRFDAYQPTLRLAYAAQLVFILLGGAAFVFFLVSNIPLAAS